MLQQRIDWQEGQKGKAEFDTLHFMGEMAVNIGHQVRNPMTTIRGYLQLFSRKHYFAEYREQISTMIEEIDQVNAVITELLSLAPNKRLDLKKGSINAVITKLSPILEANLIKTGHDFNIDMGNIPELVFDEKELSVLILNLVKNSQEATPIGGSIFIRSSAVNEYVILSIQDTGRGIPDEIMDKLGSPLILARDNKVGLGLAICYRIAQHHKANIAVTTSSHGTTINIYFAVNKNL